MRRHLIVALSVLTTLAVPLLLLAAEYTESFTYSLSYSASWSAEVPTTYYYTYSLAYGVYWRALPLPSAYSEYPFEFSVSWCAMPYITIRTYLGESIVIEQKTGIAPITLDQYFWDGGVAITSDHPATAVIYTNKTLYSTGACSLRKVTGGYEVNLTGGRCVVGEKVWYVILDVVDPQGFTKYGIKVLVNNTPVEPGVIYTAFGHTHLHIELGNAKLGSVYLNDTKIGVGPIDIYLANATMFRIKLVVKSLADVSIESVEFRGTGDYIRMTLTGKVTDAVYGAPVSGAEVRVYLEDVYAGYAYTNGSGLFYIDTLVRNPGRTRAELKLRVTHDDYEELETTRTVSIPREVAITAPVSLWQFAVAAAVSAAIAGAIATGIATVLLRRRRRKEYFVRTGK